MKIYKVIAGIFFFIYSHQLTAQYKSSDQYNLGALLAFGGSKGPAVDNSSLFSQGTYNTQTSALAFAFNFTTVGHRKGFRFGPVFSLALGGSNDRFMAEGLGAGWSDNDGKWGSDFGIFIDWKIGGSINYVLPDKEATVGFRYFNWYLGNVFGSSYSNADDAATVGLTANYKKLGLAFSYGSQKIPGFLVNSHSWNNTEIEARYQLKYNDETKGGIILGARYLNQNLLVSTKTIYEPDTQGNLFSFFILFH